VLLHFLFVAMIHRCHQTMMMEQNDDNDRLYDVVVFGASGFTGKYITLEIARIIMSTQIVSSTTGRPNPKKVIRWAIGGRSEIKLRAVQKMIKEYLIMKYDAPDNKDLEVPIVIAQCGSDVENRNSLRRMCQQTKVVLNCTGPYRFYGEDVVQACVASSTHYLDITGEPEFIETIRYKYMDLARKNHSLVITSCGFDSVPSDMGIVYTTQQYHPQKTITTTSNTALEPRRSAVHSIEAFLSLRASKCHFTTYECMVHGLANVSKFRQQRKSYSTTSCTHDHDMIGSSSQKKKTMKRLTNKMFGYDKRIQKYWIRFPGADAPVVRQSQKDLATMLYPNKNNEYPINEFGIYLTLPNLLGLIVVLCFGVILHTFTRLGSFGTSLLLRYPSIFTFGFFTHDGPTKKEVENGSFSMDLYSTGYNNSISNNNTTIYTLQRDSPPLNEDIDNNIPNWEVITRVSGPEPAYIATSIIMIQCCLCVLEGEVPIAGGVITTATAFRQTSLITRLQQVGITFQVVRSGPLQSHHVK
jgi:short subunit dehydrogenase-like uncharacterized protein